MELFKNTTRDNVSGVDIELLEKVRFEYKHIGSLKKVPGLTLFSFNEKTKQIKVAEVERCKTIHFHTQKPLVNDKIVVEPFCIYVQALNKRNFVRKLNNLGHL